MIAMAPPMKTSNLQPTAPTAEPVGEAVATFTLKVFAKAETAFLVTAKTATTTSTNRIRMAVSTPAHLPHPEPKSAMVATMIATVRSTKATQAAEQHVEVMLVRA